jgi:hypothetical protein
MNHFLLHTLAVAVAPALSGRRVGLVRLLPPVLSIEFSEAADSRYGVVILSTPGPFCYFDSADPIAGLGTEVFRRIRGFPVVRVEVPPNDRVVRFELFGPREKVALSVSLFGSTAKIRVEGRETIIESLDARESGRPLPPQRSWEGVSFAAVDASALAPYLVSPEALEQRVSGLARELLDCFTLPDGGIEVKPLLAFRDRVLRGEEAFTLGTRMRAGAVVPRPAAGEGAERRAPMPAVYGPFTNAEEACKNVGASILISVQDDIIQRCAAPLKKHVSGRRRLLSALEQQRKEAESYDACRQEANMLVAYQSRIPSGATEVTLPNLYGAGERTITLDPSTPIRDQIKKRFRRAAKLERSRAAVDKRIRMVAQEIERMEKDLTDAKDEALFGDTIRRVERAKRHYGFDAGPRQTERPHTEPRQLRRFDLDDQWFVLVGRSDRENDEITFRIASPDDIWLHAQHVAGSHVVLKSRGSPGNPPDFILEAAAAVAAHFSKARRASVVPVIYTRRKYVRKFKGSKLGQVVCEREKTIFAEPKLPESDGG